MKNPSEKKQVKKNPQPKTGPSAKPARALAAKDKRGAAAAKTRPKSQSRPHRFGKSLQFTIKDVRCFAGRQKFEIRPVTFLTGENSAGKTTFLGCFHALMNSIFRSENIFDFNQKPYEMGSFDTIARRAEGEKKTAEPFFELGVFCGEPEFKYAVRFIRDQNAKPIADLIQAAAKSVKADFKYKNEKWVCNFVSRKDEANNFKIESSNPHESAFLFSPLRFFWLMEKSIILQGGKKLDKKEKKLLEEFNLSLREARRVAFPQVVINSAPVRSKPDRYYRSFIQKEHYDPEGSDMPMLLMNLNFQHPKQWKKLSEKLTKFGRASELFDDIEVKKLEEGLFQIKLKLKGASANIRDTGYGISQALPILGHVFLSPPASHLLLQQPEVHLHPKAQAALASLFIESAKTMGKSFLIETHSDYMVDRARIEIRKGRIPPDHVSLIYLESKGGRARAHNISFDKEGNMRGAPEGYREFFLKETDDFLGVES